MHGLQLFTITTLIKILSCLSLITFLFDFWIPLGWGGVEIGPWPGTSEASRWHCFHKKGYFWCVGVCVVWCICTCVCMHLCAHVKRAEEDCQRSSVILLSCFLRQNRNLEFLPKPGVYHFQLELSSGPQ